MANSNKIITFVSHNLESRMCSAAANSLVGIQAVMKPKNPRMPVLLSVRQGSLSWCRNITSSLGSTKNIYAYRRTRNGVFESAQPQRISDFFLHNYVEKIIWNLPKSMKFSNRVSNVYVPRPYSTATGSEGMTEKELKREIDELTDQFMETRELFADAMETKGSVYFNEDLQEAKHSLNETLERYGALLSKLSEEQRRNVQRTIGLKMDELKAQEAMIMEELKED